MLTPFRQIKRNARRDLHTNLQVPAVYLSKRDGTPVLIHVRLHNTWDTSGDVKGARVYGAEMENLTPKIVFDLGEQAPNNSGIVTMQAGESYLIDHTMPPDDTWQHAYVTRMPADKAAGLPHPSDDGLTIVTPP